jgi:hypothetical protein
MNHHINLAIKPRNQNSNPYMHFFCQSKEANKVYKDDSSNANKGKFLEKYRNLMHEYVVPNKKKGLI